MKPSSPRRPLTLLIAASFALCLAGCDKPSPEDEVLPRDGRETTRLPSPTPEASPDRTGRRALSAYAAVSDYLRDQDPDLRGKVQKAAERFARDKDRLRARLRDRQRELQPRIARLRDQISTAQGKSTDAVRGLRQELAGLESQRSDAEHRLSELETITDETWKAFRERLQIDAEQTPSPSSPR